MAGCGREDEADGGAVAGSQLRIYSSMPLEGPEAPAARDVVRGQELALREHGERIGRYAIELVSLDAATPETDRWDPEKISDNARRAASDPETIAYVGEYHTGSSAISIPRLNEVGLLGVSPSDTAMELTSRNLAVPGSPEKYFPKAEQFGRTFARLAPSDRWQAVAQLEYMGDERVQRLVIVTDEDPLGTGYATVMRPRARAHGIAIVGQETVDPHEQDPRDLVERIVRVRPDAVFYAGAVHDGIVRLMQDLTVAEPRVKLFAPSAVVDKPFIAAVGAAGGALRVTSPVRALRDYPAPARRFARRFEKRYGNRPLPQALYGYETMNAVLAAIRTAAERAGESALDRADVVAAFRATRRDDTVLGSYEIVSGGDTTLRSFGAYRVVGGRLRYVGPLDG